MTMRPHFPKVNDIAKVRECPLDVWSRRLLVHSYRVIRRMRYGPGSTWERHDDRGGPSSDTESLRALAKRYGINQKTVAKWKGRTSVPTGPKEPKSTVLSVEEEACRRSRLRRSK
jgi:hypothetical protein